MELYLNYIRKRKLLIIQIGIGLFLLSISEVMIWPHVARSWSHDTKIKGLFLVIGIVAALLGFAILIRIVIKNYKRKEEINNKWIGKVILMYIALQLVIAVVVGFISLGLGQFFERELITTIIYWISGMIQTLIRILFIYIFVTKFYNNKIKERVKILYKVLLFGALSYLALVVFRLMLSGLVLQISQIIWEVACTVFFIVYLGENMRERTKNE